METSEGNENNPLVDTSVAPPYGYPLMEKILRLTVDGYVTRYSALSQRLKGIGVGSHIATSEALNAGFAVLWWVPEPYLDSMSESLQARFGWIQSHLQKELTKAMYLQGRGMVMGSDAKVRGNLDIG